LRYIDEQTQAQQEEQEEMKNLEIEFKDREIKVNEQKNIMDFTIDMAKISQMTEKDQKSMITKFAGLDVQKQSAMLTFVAQMAATMANKEATEKAAKEQKKGDSK
jgi:hypothetical protein